MISACKFMRSPFKAIRFCVCGQILRVTTDAHDRSAIKALIQELELRRLEARDPQ